MNVTIQQMEKLLQGQYTFKQLGFSMLLTRLKSSYADAPTQANLETCVNDINAFIAKYSGIMSDDIAIIEKI
ncbi:MAG: hypothetical protein LBU88_06475 [Treponema sp.]|jgi:hypothetical protein|nr:hypothetical protein [Treponema sp.]